MNKKETKNVTDNLSDSLQKSTKIENSKIRFKSNFVFNTPSKIINGFVIIRYPCQYCGNMPVSVILPS